jgi:hypothetical protein
MLRKHNLTVAAAALSALLMAACGKNDRAYTDSAKGTVVATDSVRVTDLTIGKGIGADRKITNATDTFSPTDTIHATVKTTGASPSATLTARWTFEDTVAVDEQVQMISPTGDAVTDFHITKGTPWPKGKYKLTILLNGREVDSESFTIR